MQAPETKYARVGEACIAWQVMGEGALDLVYAGGMATHIDQMWDFPEVARFLRRLASFSRLIVFDHRGSGLSDPPPGGGMATWETWAEDLGAVLDAAGSSQAALMAERDAGAVAMLYAATYPERISALILGNTCARFLRADDYPEGDPPGATERVLELVRQHWGTTRMVELAMPSHAQDTAFMQLAARFQRAAATPRAAAGQYRYYCDMDVRAVLPSIRCPTLILQRAQFPFLNPRHAHYLEQHIPNARRVEVPGADVFFSFDRSDEVLNRIAEFLTGSRETERPDRVLTTVLFLDIVGSTKLAARLGDAGWSDLVARFHSMMKHQLQLFRGRLVDTAGDSVFATFDSPAKALRCAVALREEAGKIDVRVRIGVHTGEVELMGENVRGLAVHIGARIMAEAERDEILASSTVRHLVVDAGFEFKDCGTHRLKDVPGKWRLSKLVTGLDKDSRD